MLVDLLMQDGVDSCCAAQGNGDTVLIADIGGTNCRFELWKIDMTGGGAHQELYHQVAVPQKNLSLIPEVRNIHSTYTDFYNVGKDA